MWTYFGQETDVEAVHRFVGLGAGIHVVADSEDQFEHFLEMGGVSNMITGCANFS